MNKNSDLRGKLLGKKTISVSRDLGLKGSYSSNLTIKRKKNTNNFYAHYLPEEELDSRPHAGRTSGGTGKRIEISKSMKSDDPIEAGERAIKWYSESMKMLKSCKVKEHLTLASFWKTWFATQCVERKSKRNFDRWKRDTKAKWEGEGYGIKHQVWASKEIDNITAKDFSDYFALLTSRGKSTNASGIKEAQKTLINHLYKEARNSDHFADRNLFTPEFPSIGRQKKQVPHFTIHQWELILRAVIDKSGGIANTRLSKEEYENSQFTPYLDENQRNWIDLYDALQLMWFYHLRAEDMVRIKSEWWHKSFKDEDNLDSEYVCNLQVTKKDRSIHKTYSFKNGSDECCERILLRKPSGYIVFPDKKRDSKNESANNTIRKLNKLLKVVIQENIDNFPLEYQRLTTIRHTAFRLTLEQDPSLGSPNKIHSFAFNGHTSVKQLQETYLKEIDAERHAKESRKRIKKKQKSSLFGFDIKDSRASLNLTKR